jgi:hypothetical protein
MKAGDFGGQPVYIVSLLLRRFGAAHESNGG